MEVVERTARTWEPDQDKAKRFAEPRVGRDGDFCIRDADTGEISVIQKVVDLGSMLDLPRLLRHLRFKGFFNVPTNGSIPRASGIKAKEQWIGWVPPDNLRRRYSINRSQLYLKNPELGYTLEELTAKLWDQLVALAPKQTDEHERLVRTSIHSDYLLGGAPFTSGIINHTNVLPYHRDSGNLKGSWSMMLALRKGDEGGALHIPEYDETLAIPNCSLTFFNGQHYWHGVTPVALRDKDAYRFTIVWYVKDTIRKCGPWELERIRAAQAATEAMRTAGNPGWQDVA